MGTDLATALVYGLYAAGPTVLPNSMIFALFAVPYVVIAFGLVYGDRR